MSISGDQHQSERKGFKMKLPIIKETTAEKLVKPRKIPSTSLGSPWKKLEEEAQRNKIEGGMRMGGELLKAYFSNQHALVVNRE